MEEGPGAPATGNASRDDFKKCPYCAELIRVEAILCRFCNRELEKRPPEEPAPTRRSTTIGEIVDHGVSRNEGRREIQMTIRRRRANARIAGAGCFVAGVIAVIAYGGDSPGAGTFWLLLAFVLLIMYFVLRPPYTGAMCPHCKGFAVRSSVRSGCVSSTKVLRCDDCSAEFGGVSSGCVVLLAMVLSSLLAAMVAILGAFA